MVPRLCTCLLEVRPTLRPSDFWRPFSARHSWGRNNSGNLGEVDGHALHLIFGERLGGHCRPSLMLEIDVRNRLCAGELFAAPLPFYLFALDGHCNKYDADTSRYLLSISCRVDSPVQACQTSAGRQTVRHYCFRYCEGTGPHGQRQGAIRLRCRIN